ncbi:MAG: RsmE family RNA methyltransferase [bacterium]|nr:RsmE family RNA methyltransferase [bacterium]
MRLHRFFTTLPIEEGETNSIPDPSIIHQMTRVLRLQTGDEVMFFDGSGNEYQSEIVLLDKNIMKFRVLKTIKIKRYSSLKLSLAFSLIKKDNVEWIIQKCTELGVSEFIPLVSERSEKKGFNLERAQKICIEACEQSGRGDIPKIREPQTLAEFLEAEKRKIIVFHTGGNNFERESLLKSPNSNSKLPELVVCIGPEGGWSEREISLFKEKGASIVSLNTPILRAETAAVAIIVLLLVE